MLAAVPHQALLPEARCLIREMTSGDPISTVELAPRLHSSRLLAEQVLATLEDEGLVTVYQPALQCRVVKRDREATPRTSALQPASPYHHFSAVAGPTVMREHRRNTLEDLLDARGLSVSDGLLSLYWDYIDGRPQAGGPEDVVEVYEEMAEMAFYLKYTSYEISRRALVAERRNEAFEMAEDAGLYAHRAWSDFYTPLDADALHRLAKDRALRRYLAAHYRPRSSSNSPMFRWMDLPCLMNDDRGRALPIRVYESLQALMTRLHDPSYRVDRGFQEPRYGELGRKAKRSQRNEARQAARDYYHAQQLDAQLSRVTVE